MMDVMDHSFIESVFSEELARMALDVKPGGGAPHSFLAAFRDRAGILNEVGPGSYTFLHLTFREYLAAVALARKASFIELALEKSGEAIWAESIVLAVGHASRSSPQRSDEVIRRLEETRNPASLILAGRCVLEVVQISVELRQTVSEALGKLLIDANVPDAVREQAKGILQSLKAAN